MASFTHSIVVIGAHGKKFKITESYYLSSTGAEAVNVDDDDKSSDLNQWVRREGVEVVP